VMRVTGDGSSLREEEDGGNNSNFSGANDSLAAGVDKREGGEGGALVVSAERKKGKKKGTAVMGAAPFIATRRGGRGGWPGGEGQRPRAGGRERRRLACGVGALSPE
jgi:hypothetical protein